MNLIIQAPVNFTMPRIEAAGYQFGHWHDGWHDCVNGVANLFDWARFNEGIQRTPVGGLFMLSLEGVFSQGLADDVLCRGTAQHIDDLVNYVRALDRRPVVYRLPFTGDNLDACYVATRQCWGIMTEHYNFDEWKFDQLPRARSIKSKRQKQMAIVCPRWMQKENACELIDEGTIHKGVKRLKEAEVEYVWVFDDPTHVEYLMPGAPQSETKQVYENDLLAFCEAVKGVAN